MRQIAYLLVSLGVLLAGCVSPPSDDVTGQNLVTDPPLLADVAAALEAGEPAANVDLLGEFRDGNGAEVDAWGDFLFVMSSGTVRILNVSDPANITEVSVIDPEHAVLDVKVSDDGAYLFVGDDQEASGALGGTGPLLGGIHVYDVRDKANPTFVSYQPVGERRGPHMVAYHVMPDGTEIVMGANADVSIHTFDRDTGTLTEVARYMPDLVFGFNRDPQVFDVLYQGWAHDMFAQTEPDGSVYMYVANWDAGIRVVDITDPAAPKELGGWNDFPDGDEGNLHTVSAQWIGDRRIVVGAVEVGFAVVGGYHYAMGTDHSVVYVWDATDPANIQLLSTWENPIDPTSGRDYFGPAGETLTSTHNLQLEDGRIYLAHYGLGVWIIDVRTPDAPVTVGYYNEGGMSTWDVVVHEGVTFSSGSEGILGLHFVTDVLGEDGIVSRA